MQKLAGDSRQVRCYDIANAGPRFRYTVAGKLVLNCVLGLGYQMGAPKLQMTLAKGALGGPKIALPIDQCQHIVNTYRRKYYAIKQGWDRSKDFIEHMANPGLEPLQYKCLEIGFEYIRLPNGMCLKYPDLRMAKGEKGWDEWSYQSGDIRKKIYGGLLCLGASTEVLTDDGWKPIISVRHDDKLWDGTNWVSHSGLVRQGVKETVSFGGVDMTPDHEVLVNSRWYAAERTTHHEATSSFARHHRHPFRHADRPYAPLASSRNIRDRENDAALPSHAQLASGQDVRQTKRQKQAVFDLADAGPLKRFTVRGDDGLPFIVHNCENLVQALARIIVAEQMLMIDKKYPIVMTTHDEAVAHPRTSQAQACFKYMTKCFRTPLWWCEDIPLSSSGGFAPNYSK